MIELKKVDYVIGGIPVSVMPSPPEDQTGCIKENCQSCEEEIWISEKKRALRETLPKDKTATVCFPCALMGAKLAGKEPETVDILKPNWHEKVEKYRR